MREELTGLLSEYGGGRDALVPILQEVQEKFGYLSQEAISGIGRALKLSESDIFGVATFYAQFRFSHPGKHSVKVCLGTACHVRGGGTILESVERDLKVPRGGTTQDYQFSLERVACFGCCALAPVMVVDKDVYGRMTTTRAREIIVKYMEERIEP